MVGDNNDSFTEVTSQGLGSRLMESIKGVLVGLVMFIAAFPVLWINEGCAVKTAKGLEEGLSAVVSVKSDTFDAVNNAKLVHMSGQAVTNEILSDNVFGISQQGIKLNRNVEMFQWKEVTSSKKEKKLGGGEETKTTYTYEKDWASDRIDSGKFKKSGHNNPGMPYKGNSVVAKLVKLGAFRLTPSLINQVSTSEALPLRQENLNKLPADIKGRSKLFNEGIYVGANPSDPQIGDMRINYSIVRPQMVSIISKQIGDTFEAYKTKTNTEINRLESGEHSANAMFSQMEKENTMRTWFVRIGGFILMALGIGMIFKPISTLGDVVPILGNILGMGIGVLAFIVALLLSLVTIAIAWVAYRPVLGLIILGAGVGAFAIIWFLAKQKKAKAAPAA